VICKDCAHPLSVEQTLKGDDVDVRIQPCACGSRWLTETRIIRRLQGTHIRGTGKVPLPDKQGTCTPADGRGGGGGVPSGPIPPDSDPGIHSASLSNQTRARRNSDAIVYPQSFEVLWEQTGRRGVKANAHKAWLKMDRPGWEDVEHTWRAYLLSERPVAGFVKDLSSWLNGRCHQQEWPPARTPSKPQMSAVPPWVQAQKDDEQRRRDERNREAEARERIRREMDEAVRKAGVA
jgi:hypothetical protein